MVLDGVDEEEKKKRLRLFLIYTIMAWTIIIALIIYIGPPSEAPSEFEETLGIDWSTIDFRPFLLIVGILAYLRMVVPIFVVHKKKQKKAVENEVDEYFDKKPFEPQ